MSSVSSAPKDRFHDDASLELACVGNCAFSCLIDKKAQVVWSCYPRFDGDPIFCSLLKRSTSTSNDIGFWDIQIPNFDRSEQSYLKNSAVLSTKLFDKNGNGLEVTDCVPRFEALERQYRPNMLIRTIKPIKGRPRVQIKLRPTFGYGWGVPEKTRGSNHVRYLLSNMTIRLTTNAPISYVVDEVVFDVEEPLYLCLMPDESLKLPLNEMSTSYLEKTLAWWRSWVKNLTIPYEWQDQVIRSLITLKMANFEETGAIVSSMTTSVPRNPSGDNRDGRYCWLREAQRIVQALRMSGVTNTMEEYMRFIANIVADFTENGSEPIQPVFGISLEKRMAEREMHRLPGYRGIGPVKLGSSDADLVQHDIYGCIIMSMSALFYDRRLHKSGDEILFKQLEALGEYAKGIFNQPDNGPRGNGSQAVHTFSSVMCWVACDRLGKISQHMNYSGREQYWKSSADTIKQEIIANAFNKNVNSFVSQWGSDKVDSYLLLLPELKFVDALDEKFIGTLAKIEKDLVKEKIFVNFSQEDSVAVNAATFDYINALISVGRKDEARTNFEKMLKHLNSNGLLSETIDPKTGALWGNFPQNSANVGLITCATRLSHDWEEAC